MSDPDCVIASILTGTDCSALYPITTGCPVVKLVAAVPPLAIESGNANGSMAVLIAQNDGAPLDPLQFPNTVSAPAVAAPVPPFVIESGSVNGSMAVLIAQNDGAP